MTNSTCRDVHVYPTTVWALDYSTVFDPRSVTNMTNGSEIDHANQTDRFILPLEMKIPLIITVVLAMLFSIFGNTIVCFIVYHKPAMRSAINLLLANMAFSNILLCVICSPFAIVTLIRDVWVFSHIFCEVISCLHLTLVCESMTVLFTISIDRFLIIVQHRDKLTPVRAKIIICVTWCLSMLVSFPPLIGWGHYIFQTGESQCFLQPSTNSTEFSYVVISTCAIFYFPMLIMAYTYLCIINTVRRNSIRIQNLPDNTGPITMAQKLGANGSNAAYTVTVDMSFKTRAFKTILILYLVFVICWLPHACCCLIWDTVPRNHFISTTILWFSYLNCAFNPVIYCWRIGKFREAVVELFPSCSYCVPKLPKCTQRRINPSALYRYNETAESAL